MGGVKTESNVQWPKSNVGEGRGAQGNDWSSVATNYFDITGSTSFTNPISSDQPQQFFQLQVN